MRGFRIHWPTALLTVAIVYFVLPWVLGMLSSRKAAK